MKQAFSFDQDGYFCGSVPCQASPLEDGVWLLPGHSTFAEPMQAGADQEAKWDGQKWTLVKSREAALRDQQTAEDEAKPIPEPLREQDPTIQPVMTKQQLGAEVVAKVYLINERKGFDAETLLALMDDGLFSKIERLCWGGALETARDLVPSISDKFYTDEDKAEVVAMINGFLK